MAILFLASSLAEQKNAALSHIPFENAENSPDTLWLTGDPSITIEMIRDLISWTQTTPYVQAKKYAVVLGANSMTVQAQQALLKTLEEPPAQVEIFLTAPHEVGLLPTIQSRCTVVRSAHTQSEADNEAFVFPNTIRDAIDAAEQIGKDRETAVAWCEHQLIQLHQQEHATKKAVRQLQKIAETLGLLKRNVNTKLALESMFFDLQK
jgi:hypothetical protein